jgi:preprotein translocase subunit SecD
LVAGLVGAVALTLPGDDQDSAGETGDTSFFALRPVTSGEPTQGQPCPAPTVSPDSAVLCSVDATVVVGMGPVIVDAGNVVSAEATPPPAEGAGWSVNVTLDEPGAEAFAEATEQASTEQPPANRIAIVVDEQVVSVPEVNAAIDSGELQIGGLDQVDAEQLANRLTS